jgi:hypothetical protein
MPKRKPFIPDLDFVALETEEVTSLHYLIEDARLDYKPRNFGERHLVDELALCKWRQLRVLTMQRSIYDRQLTEFDQTRTDDPDDPNNADPMRDTFHTAMAHAHEQYAVVLAALSRLETRYHRQFCSALRLLHSLQSNSSQPTPKEDK